MSSLKTYRITETHRDIINQLMKIRTFEETGEELILDGAMTGPIMTEYLYIFIAEFDGEYAGWISACIIPKAGDKLGTLYIDELWVKEELRRNRIAEALMDEAIKIAKEKNLWKVRLVVGEDNPAKYLYEKVGFELSSLLFGEMDVI